VPYKVERRTRRKVCSRLLLDPPPGHPGWEFYLDERVVTIRTWSEPDYYLYKKEQDDMKREASETQKKAGKYKHLKGTFFDNYPLIEEQLGDCWWDDGKPRQPCHLKIEIIGDMIHIALIDTGERRSCHTASKDLGDGLGLLEAHMAAGSIPWRSWGPERGQRK